MCEKRERGNDTGDWKTMEGTSDGRVSVLSGVCKFVATPGNVANSMVINLSRYPREPGGLMDLTPRLTGII